MDDDDDDDDETTYLPGYEAQINDSGVDHSQQKLRQAKERIQQQLLLSASSSSSSSSNPSSSDIDDIIQSLPCTTESSTWSYRCRCNFQIIASIVDRKRSSSNNHSCYYSYAMRERGRPEAIDAAFPIATRRIQHAMKVFLHKVLNNHKGTEVGNPNLDDFHAIRTNLTSCTFSSSWKDVDDVDPDDDGVDENDDTSIDFDPSSSTIDCILTLHYDQPLDGHATEWKHAANHVCQMMRLKRLNGRSKGVLLSVSPSSPSILASSSSYLSDVMSTRINNTSDYTNDDDTGAIRDVVYLIPPNIPVCGEQIIKTEGNNVNDVASWTVTLMKPSSKETIPPSSKSDDERSSSMNTATITNKNSSSSSSSSGDDYVKVFYEKPETAFYHPNAHAMVDALAWLLNRLDVIVRHKDNDKGVSKITGDSRRRKLSVLEMYCGCGAHTVALGKSGMIDRILAIELDSRLVSACEHNVKLNRLETVVDSRRGDAGTFAREWQRSRRCRNEESNINPRPSSTECDINDETVQIDPRMKLNQCDYDVLLVDPPRQGLDLQVCKMAINVTTFHDFLYISCGHQALLRDLDRLEPAYEVIQITQVDLFPRTDSIETLVHLRRRAHNPTNIENKV